MLKLVDNSSYESSHHAVWFNQHKCSLFFVRIYDFLYFTHLFVYKNKKVADA